MQVMRMSREWIVVLRVWVVAGDMHEHAVEGKAKGAKDVREGESSQQQPADLSP